MLVKNATKHKWSFCEMIKTDSNGASLYGIVDAAQNLGFDTQPLEGHFEELIEEIQKQRIRVPFIARIISEEHQLHYVVVYEVKKNYVVLGDPAKKVLKMKIELFKHEVLLKTCKEYKEYWEVNRQNNS